MTEFPLPTAQAAPYGITSTAEGTLWFTESSSAGGKIGEFNPGTRAFTEFPIPTVQGTPKGITVGPDGNIWFTEFGAPANTLNAGAPSQIGQLNVSTGVITEFPDPDTSSGPTGIVTGPDGNLYFTETTANAIGEVNLSTPSPTITDFPLTASGQDPTGITLGYDGDLWYTATGKSAIGRFDPTTDKDDEYSTPTKASGPQGITSGPDGNQWFTDGVQWFTEVETNQIGWISSESGETTTAFLVPSNATFTVPAGGKTYGPGSTILANTVLPIGTFAEFALPSGAAGPWDISAPTSGQVSFSLSKSDQIAQLGPTSGAVTLFQLPTASADPRGILEADSSIWFTEESGNNLGVMQSVGPWYSSARLYSPLETTEGEGATFELEITSEASGTPTGTVVFTLDGVAQPPVPLNSSGKAFLSPKGLSAGTHVVTAAYSGDSSYLPSSSNTAYSIVISSSESATDTAIDQTVSTLMRKDNLTGLSVAVVRTGQTPFIRSYGLADVATGQVVAINTPFEIGPVTKTYTALAVLLLAQDQNLVTKSLTTPFNLNEPLENYLSDDPANNFSLPAIWDNITTEQLLAMSSGIIDIATSNLTWQQNLNNASGQLLAGTPGTGFLYSDTAFMLLGELIQQLSGQDYATFLQTQILNPLGLGNTVVRDGSSVPAGQATGYLTFDASSNNWQLPQSYRPGSASFSSGAISTTASDMATYLQGLLDQKVISASSYAEMFAPIPLIMFETPNTPVTRGLSWDSVTPSVNGGFEIAKNGGLPGFSAEYVLWPSQNLAIGVMSNNTNFNILGVAESIYAAIQIARTGTTTTLKASETSLTTGDSLLLTALVQPASGGPATGQVAYTVDGVIQPPTPLIVSEGVARAILTLSGLSQGAHVITAQYSGSLGYAPSTANPLVISVNPADGPRVLSVVRQGIFLQPPRLVISFSSQLNAASATDVGNYILTRVTLRGRTRPIKLISAKYDTTTGTVTLRPRFPIMLSGVYRLVINGETANPIRDIGGRALDGMATGLPGSNYTAIITLGNFVPRIDRVVRGDVQISRPPRIR